MSTKKYHIVYQTTNLINNKIYIGKHTTYNLNDDYLGSGKHLRRAVNKYGKENFRKEILFILETEQEALDKEKELVNLSFICDIMTYNLQVGGNGGWPKGSNHPFLGKKHTNDTKQKISFSNSGKKPTEEVRKKMSNTHKTNGSMVGDKNPAKRADVRLKISLNHADVSGENNSMYGKSHSIETKNLLSKRRKEWFSNPNNINSTKGENNPMYGKGLRIWVCNQETSKLIKKELVEEYIKLGYCLGRKLKL